MKSFLSALTLVASIFVGVCSQTAQADECHMYPGPGAKYFKRSIKGFKPQPVCDINDGGDADDTCKTLKTKTISESEIFDPSIEAKVGGVSGVNFSCKGGPIGEVYHCLAQNAEYASGKFYRALAPVSFFEWNALGLPRRQGGLRADGTHDSTAVPQNELMAWDPVYNRSTNGKIFPPDNWSALFRQHYENRLARLAQYCADNGFSCDQELEVSRSYLPRLLKEGHDYYVAIKAMQALDKKLPSDVRYSLPEGFNKYNCKNIPPEPRKPKENEEYFFPWGDGGSQSVKSDKAKGAGASIAVGGAGGAEDKDKNKKKPPKRSRKGGGDGKGKPNSKGKGEAVGPATTPDPIETTGPITQPSQVEGPVTRPSQVSGPGNELGIVGGNSDTGSKNGDKKGTAAISSDGDKPAKREVVGHKDGIEEGHGTNGEGNSRKNKNLDHKGPAASQNQLDYAEGAKERVTDADNTRPVLPPRNAGGGWALTSKEAPHCSEFMGKHNHMCLGTGLENDLVSLGKNKALIESFCEKEVKKSIGGDKLACPVTLLNPAYAKVIGKNCKKLATLVTELKKPYGQRTPQDAACKLWFTELNGIKDVPNFGEKKTITDAYGDSGAKRDILENMADFVEDGAQRDLGAYSVIKQSQFLFAIAVNVNPASVQNHTAVSDSILRSASCLNSAEKGKVREGIAKAATEMAGNTEELSQMQSKWVTALVQGAREFQQAKQKMDAVAKVKKKKGCGTWQKGRAMEKDFQVTCASLQTSYDQAEAEYNEVANNYPILQEELTKKTAKDDPAYVRVDKVDKIVSGAILNRPLNEELLNTHKIPLWKLLTDSKLQPNEAMGWAKLAAQKVMNDGLERLKDVCSEGLHHEGRRAADIYPLVEGYLSCDDLKEGEEIVCKGRANAAWTLCRTQSGERIKEERQRMKNMLKMMAMAAGGAIAMVLTAGGASVLAAVVGIGMSSYSVATGIHDYVTHDEGKLQRAATMDFHNQFSDFETFKSAMSAAEGPSLASTVAWATLDVVFMGLDVGAIGRIIKDGTQSARVLKAVKAAERLEDPVSRMRFIDELREGRVTEFGIDGRRVIDNLTPDEAKEVRKLIDKRVKLAGEKEMKNVADARKVQAHELKPVKGEKPMEVWVKGGKKKKVASVDEKRNVVIFEDGTELSMDKLMKMGSGDKKQIVENIGAPGKGAVAAANKTAVTRTTGKSDDVIELNESDIEIVGDVKGGTGSGSRLGVGPKWGKLPNEEWGRRVGNHDLEEVWTVGTKAKGEAEVGDTVVLPDGSEARIKYARRDPKSGKDWVELSNGDVVQAELLTAKPSPTGAIGKLDEGRTVLLQGSQRKTIKSVDESRGVVEFTDGTRMDRSKLGRIGEGKRRPIVELGSPPSRKVTEAPDAGGTRKVENPGNYDRVVDSNNPYEEISVNGRSLGGASRVDVVVKPSKRFEDWGRMKNPEWKTKFGDTELDLEQIWTVKTRKGDSQVGDLVKLPDGSEARIVNARREHSTGRDWIELSNGDVIPANYVDAKEIASGAIGKLDEGRTVLLQGAERKTIKSVDEAKGTVEFTDGTTMDRSKLGRIGESKNKPIVEIIDASARAKPKPPAPPNAARAAVNQKLAKSYPKAKIEKLSDADANSMLKLSERIENTRVTSKAALSRGDKDASKALSSAADEAEREITKVLDGCL